MVFMLRSRPIETCGLNPRSVIQPGNQRAEISFHLTGHRRHGTSRNGGSGSKIVLGDGWAIQPSEKVQEGGSSLATIHFKPKGWYPAKVPATVLAALVESGVYPDPYFGMNPRSIPGTEYPIGQNFSNLPIPANSPFRPSWSYRTEFPSPAEFDERRIWLGFEGINYRANVWLNGRLVADATKIAGAWRLFELDVTGVALTGRKNALAFGGITRNRFRGDCFCSRYGGRVFFTPAKSLTLPWGEPPTPTWRYFGVRSV